MALAIALPTRSGDVRLPVELSAKELKSLARIIGAEVEALAWLTVRVKVKREKESDAQHAESENQKRQTA